MILDHIGTFILKPVPHVTNSVQLNLCSVLCNYWVLSIDSFEVSIWVLSIDSPGMFVSCWVKKSFTWISILSLYELTYCNGINNNGIIFNNFHLYWNICSIKNVYFEDMFYTFKLTWEMCFLNFFFFEKYLFWH